MRWHELSVSSIDFCDSNNDDYWGCWWVYRKLMRSGIFWILLVSLTLSPNFTSEFLSLWYKINHIYLNLSAACSIQLELGTHFVGGPEHSYFLNVGSLGSLYVYIMWILPTFSCSMDPISELSLCEVVCSLATSPFPS